jgi:ABC-2 type transport system permease protein
VVGIGNGPHFLLPPGAGAAGRFAIGQSDLLPYAGPISLWDPDVRLFSRYEFEDPIALALGAFDLSKAVILVLPLLLIVLSFDVLSGERDANRLTLILAQGVGIRRLMWGRLLIRAAPALGMVLLIAAAALLLNRGAVPLESRLPAFALWVLGVLLYGAFWIAMIAFVASSNGRGTRNVMVLGVAWAALTLILPAAATTIAEAIYPTPSRLVYLADAREIEIQTELAEPGLRDRIAAEHPDLFVQEASAMPAYVRTAFLVTSAVDAATRPVLEGFESAASNRDEALGFLRYLSPAIVTHGLFNDVAGASAARHRRYMAQARELKAAYAKQVGRYIVAGRRLPLGETGSLPKFEFQDDTLGAISRRNAAALFALGFATFLLLALADRRLKRAAALGE